MNKERISMWTEMGPNMQLLGMAILISLCVFISSPDGYGSQEAKAGAQSSTILTNQDQAEIVKSALERAIADPITTLNISWTEIVSSENMTESMLPRISGYEFELLEPGKIKELANRSGNIRYLVFSPMKARGGKVNVEVCRISVGTCFGWFSLSSCFKGEYRKESGSWTGELRPSVRPAVTGSARAAAVTLWDVLSIRLTPNEEINLAASYDDKPDIGAPEIAELLLEGFRAGARSGEYKAVALCVDVRVDAPDGSGKTDAIRVTLEENGGEALNVFMPYRKRVLRGIQYGEIFASAADKSVFV